MRNFQVYGTVIDLPITGLIYFIFLFSVSFSEFWNDKLKAQLNNISIYIND